MSIVVPEIIVQPSADERRERERKIKEQEERRKIADLRAEELLLDIIGIEQLERYKKTARLLVKGYKNDYLIEEGRGVKRIEKDKVVDLCIHLENRFKFPEKDNVVGLALLAKNDEKEFNRLANNHGNVHNFELPECAVM